VRARLQSAQRRDELLQAKTDEAIAANALRIALGTRLTEQISVEDLLIQLPVAGEIERYSEATIRNRPELAQFEAERRAAEYELRSAKADRLPQLTYSVGSGFVTDSLVAGSVKNHAGVQATVGVTIPIFDWGATRSRIAQAEFRKQSTEAARQIAERDFIQEFYAARQQALAARERIDLLRKSIADGETSVNTSIIRYRADEAPLTEVTDAQTTLLGLRASFYQALHDYQTAKARLARAAGH
jgi:outer membrane protein TolC